MDRDSSRVVSGTLHGFAGTLTGTTQTNAITKVSGHDSFIESGSTVSGPVRLRVIFTENGATPLTRTTRATVTAPARRLRICRVRRETKRPPRYAISRRAGRKRAG